MKKLEDEIDDLKPLESFTDKDIKSVEVSNELFENYKKIASKAEYKISEANKEQKSLLREELARVRAIKNEYGHTTHKWLKDLAPSNGKVSLCVMFSDWHVGKIVYGLDGKLLYNTELAVKLASDIYPSKILQYVADHNLANRIDEIIICSCGDLIDNEIIYDTQLHNIEMPVMLQKHWAVRGMIGFVDSLETGFKKLGNKKVKIRIEGIRGNHGRVHKGSLEVSSWEVVIYDTLDLYFGAIGNKNITVDYTMEDTKLIKVKNFTGMLRHKAPPQAETPSAKAKLGGWYELFKWDFICHGHFHHWGINSWNSKPLIRNGSFVGPDDLSNEMGVRDVRCQMIFGIGNDCPEFMHRVALL